MACCGQPTLKSISATSRHSQATGVSQLHPAQVLTFLSSVTLMVVGLCFHFFSSDDLKRYYDYVEQDVSEDNLAGLSKKQMMRIRSKLKREWFTSLMLKKKVVQINSEIKKNYTAAVKQAIVNYVLLDPEQRQRVNITSVRRVPHNSQQNRSTEEEAGFFTGT